MDGIDIGDNTYVGFAYSDYDTTPELTTPGTSFIKLIDLEEGVTLYEYILTNSNGEFYPGRTFYLRAFLADMNESFELVAINIDTVKTYDIPLGNFGTVDTKAARDITSSSATLVMDIISKGEGGVLLDVYFNWGLELHSLSTGNGSGDKPLGEYTFDLDYGLSSNTTYYYRAKINNALHGWSYGEVKSFTTLP